MQSARAARRRALHNEESPRVYTYIGEKAKSRNSLKGTRGKNCRSSIASINVSRELFVYTRTYAFYNECARTCKNRLLLLLLMPDPRRASALWTWRNVVYSPSDRRCSQLEGIAPALHRCLLRNICGDAAAAASPLSSFFVRVYFCGEVLLPERTREKNRLGRGIMFRRRCRYFRANCSSRYYFYAVERNKVNRQRI